MFAFVRDPEAEARKEEEDRHQRVGGKEEVAAAKGVDGIDCGNGEDPVDDAEAEGGGQGVDGGETAVEEDLGGVVGDDVYAAKLEGSD